MFSEKFITATTFFRILPLNCKFYLSKILMIFFVIGLSYDFLPFHILQIGPLSCWLTQDFRRKISERPFLRFCPRKSFILILKNSYDTHTLFFTFLHLALCSRNSEYYIRHLFVHNSSLHKQPFITAHFRSSLHILCITAH